MEFKKGEYIKIKELFKKHTWFTNNMYKIVELGLKNDRHPEDFYITSYNNNIYEWNYSIMIQDKECKRKIRKQKLNKINGNS